MPKSGELTIRQAAKLLGVDETVIRRHVAEGLPTGQRGKVDLVVYAAWLNRRPEQCDG